MCVVSTMNACSGPYLEEMRTICGVRQTHRVSIYMHVLRPVTTGGRRDGLEPSKAQAMKVYK